jgi:hypothetical protein
MTRSLPYLVYDAERRVLGELGGFGPEDQERIMSTNLKTLLGVH